MTTEPRTRLDFYIERNSKRCWLCFDVDERYLDTVAEQLLATGLCLGKPGKSFRVAANKRLYKYYIRIKDAASADLLEERLLNGGLEVTPAVGTNSLTAEGWELTYYRGTFYVLLRGNEETCDGFLALLDAANIRWVRARPPWNRSPWRERGFDWYILLDWDGDQEELERALEDAFRRSSDEEYLESDGESARELLEINAQLKVQIVRLTEQNDEISHTLEVEQTKHANTRQELHNQTKDRISLISKHAAEVASLKKRLRVLEAIVHPDTDGRAAEEPSLRDRIDRLEAELVTKEETLHRICTIADEDKVRADTAEADLKKAKTELQNLCNEMLSRAEGALQPRTDAGARTRRQMLDLLDRVFRGAFSTLALDDKSLSILVDRAVEPKKFVQIIAWVKDGAVRLEPVRGTTNWQEVRHGAVTNSASWRIYVKRKSDDGSGRKPVWIRQKKTQARDIEAMKLND